MERFDRREANLTLDGGWIFLSHSHLDIDRVRMVRNEFERLGFNSLAFFLKCLSDQDEIEGLIKREIDAREWFVYLDSKNARKSRWVKTELDYIKKTGKEHVFTIDLDVDLSKQMNDILWVKKQLQIYISYSHWDRPIMNRIANALIKKDFLVWTGENLSEGYNWLDIIKEKIEATAYDGICMILISNHSLQSHFVYQELCYAMRKRGRILPVYIGNPSIPEKWNIILDGYQKISMDENPSASQITSLVDYLAEHVRLQHE